MFTEIHEDYNELSKEGVETEDPASSTAVKTDLRSCVYIIIYTLKQERRAFSLVSNHLRCQNDVPSLMKE